MFVVGPNFKGVKMMPPGPHFIYYSAASRCVLCFKTPAMFFSYESRGYQVCHFLSRAFLVVYEFPALLGAQYENITHMFK